MGVFKRMLERSRSLSAPGQGVPSLPGDGARLGEIMARTVMSSDAYTYSIVPIENGFMLVQTDDTYDNITRTKVWFYATPSAAATALAAKITAARIEKG